MRPRRALLYMPGNELRKIRKATLLGVDCICMDLEDGVAQNRKQEARETIAMALDSLDFGNSERLVRINRVGSGLEVDDLRVVLQAKPDGIVIPKVDRADQINWVSAQIDQVERENGWQIGGIIVIAIIESSLAIINLPQIAQADPRLRGLIFGADDFAGDIGATRTKEGKEVFYARSVVVLHAAAYGLQAIDIVNINFNDIDGLKKEAEEGAQMGYSGKQIIHPNQVIPVQEAFTPNQRAIDQALELMNSYHQHQEAGVGAFAIDGRMVDAPMIRAAERVITLAKAAGKI